MGMIKMKKYTIGFTAGTFDMFHTGHLNLLNNAKKLCDYLIVGVNEDSLVESYKNKKPLIPAEQRLEIVSNIKSVDEAHIMNSLDKIQAAEIFNFKVVFIGSDYKNSERYIKEEARLKKIGIDINYIDYTKGVSSTLLAKKIISTEITNKFYQKEINKVTKGCIISF